jgi:type II secretion system protein J
MCRARHNLRSRVRRGFTLIELVLAMGMVAILAVSMYASMKVAFDTQQTATEAVEPGRTADLAFEFIRQDLQNTMPPHDPSTFTSQYQYLAGSFEGQSSGGANGSDADLIFFSTSSMKDHPSGNGEIKQIELTTDRVNGSTKKSLVRKCARNLSVEVSPPPADEEVLCRDVDSFAIQYFDGTNWNDSWDSTQMTPNELPVAVQVTIVLDRTPPAPGSPRRLMKFTRTFQLSASTAAEDADITSGLP